MRYLVLILIMCSCSKEEKVYKKVNYKVYEGNQLIDKIAQSAKLSMFDEDKN